eukprot:scaffold231015_cov22-Tisochrysis_lutea.AAC.1
MRQIDHGKPANGPASRHRTLECMLQYRLWPHPGSHRTSTGRSARDPCDGLNQKLSPLTSRHAAASQNVSHDC